MTSGRRQELAGKVALVTGSSRGIGKRIAIELASRGASLIINYRASPAAADEVVAEIKAVGSRAVAVKADTSRHEDIIALLQSSKEAFGRLDIVISNSGIEDFTPLPEVTPERFLEVFNVNVMGQFFIAQQAFKHLETGGSIVLTSSIASETRLPHHHSLYAGSKSAIRAFARTLSTDMGVKRIRVNAIAPGGVKSDMFNHAAWRYIPGATADWKTSEMENGLAGITPLGRVGEAEDIAKVVAFLSSDDSYWINGETIGISGGAPT